MENEGRAMHGSGRGYMPGFGGYFATEAEAGALPIGRNTPQRSPLGLYPEQLSGAPFTAPRAEQRRSWLYRIRPSAQHGRFVPIDAPGIGALGLPDPNRLRWDPPAPPRAEVDFIDGLTLMMATARDASGFAAYVYAAGTSMTRAFFDADGELLIVPVAGGLHIVTELGLIDVRPGEIALVPRGVRFRVELPDGAASGYVGENRGLPFRLPELGPIGSNGLANPRDFLTPHAWYEDLEERTVLVQKFEGRLWTTTLGHSPFDVVAWHGTLAPCKYDLATFNAINTVSFDHPDPSIFTVLTAPTDTPGTANCDFVIFPPRWMVAEDTFRPPWFHRNIMNECMGLITGAYDAKADGFAPGGMSLHSRMNAHGPDAATTMRARDAVLAPVKLADTLAFMFETHALMIPSLAAMAMPTLQSDYDACWSAMPRFFARPG